MTDREKAIVMAYTGVCMLAGDKLQIFHKYVEDIMGKPIWTHEMGDKAVVDEIKEKSKADFIALCADESDPSEPTVTYKGKLLKYTEDGFVNKYCRKNVGKTDNSSENSNKWIPVSERLPNNHEYIKNNGLFNVSDGNRSYSEWFDIYDTEKFGEPTITGFRVDYAVTAWMPLPESYKASPSGAESEG